MLKRWALGFLAVALLSTFPSVPVRADGDYQEGGVIVVDGRHTEHHFLLQGKDMFFPVLELAQALGKKAEVQGETVVWDGRPGVPVVMYQGVAYVPYRTLVSWLAGVQYGADSQRAVFNTRTAYVPHATPAGKGAATASSGISFQASDLHIDTSRGDQLTIEVTCVNNTTATLNRLVAQLILTDTEGVTGDGQHPKTYAAYEQPVGDLGPGQAKKVSFDTTVVNPERLDNGSQTFTITVSGLEMGKQSDVTIKYDFQMRQDK